VIANVTIYHGESIFFKLIIFKRLNYEKEKFELKTEQRRVTINYYIYQKLTIE